MIDIKSFSSQYHNKYYYCDGTTKYAVLKECPSGQVYWAQRGKCFSRRNKRSGSSVDTDEQPQRMTQKVLRSGIRLGDLYDAQNDKFLSGTSLWSAKELKEVKVDNRQVEQTTHLKFSSGKTSLDRLSLMDIKAELKLSFLGKSLKIYFSD